jgi:hypothetical protein
MGLGSWVNTIPSIGKLCWAIRLSLTTNNRRPHGLNAAVSSTNNLSEHGFSSEYDKQQHLNITPHQYHVHAIPYHQDSNTNSYQQNSNAAASDRPPEVYLGNSAVSFVPGHGVGAEFRAWQAVNLGPFGQHLYVFYFRTLVGILGPIAVVGYFIAIWRIYLAPLDSTSTVSFGPPGAKWVFYSWFVAGVIGLNLSLYGLAGAEAGMLMERTWRVKDAMRLMLHADNTWSGLGGWIKALNWVVQLRRARNQPSTLPSRLWFVLALPSLVVFVAWPLSGLCLEMTSGFLHGKPGQGANVTGFVQPTFNANTGGRRPSRGSYIDARVLGHGAVYTPEGFDRSQSKFLEQVPVVLPNTESVKEIFLTAQGETPIEGKAWGLLLHYDCKVVDKLSELTLLKDRKSSVEVWGTKSILPQFAKLKLSRTVDDDFPVDKPAITDFPLGPTDSLVPDPTSSFTSSLIPSTSPRSDCVKCARFDYVKQVNYDSYRLHNNNTLVEISKEPQGSFNGQFKVDLLKWSLNLDAVIETAYESLPPQMASEQEPPCGYINEMDNPPTSYCYHDMDGAVAEKYPGIEDRRVFEVLLWQRLDNLANAQADQTIINKTILRSIESLYGEYVDYLEQNLTAIGATCTSSSSVGSADIDGVRSTYSNFKRTDTPIPSRRDDCAKRFGAETLACTLEINKEGWVKWLFDSVGLPSPLDTSAKGDAGDIMGNMRSNAQLEYLQADQLQKVLLQAYSTYAIKLMYNDGRDFIGINSARLKSHVPDITAFVSGTVIGRGVMPAIIPVVLFGLWAFISSGLCLVYGFRRRWSAILDGHTVFKLGVHLHETYRAKLQQHSTITEIEDCHALHEIPGFVSDVGFDSNVGSIGLMEGKAARKDKLYR